MFCIPSAVMSGGDVNIKKTYGHLYTLKPDDGDLFQCNICVKQSKFFSEKTKEEVEKIKDLTAFHSCKRSGNIVTHIAIKHPEHLVMQHVESATYRKYAFDTLMSKPNMHSRTAKTITSMLVPQVTIGKLDIVMWFLEDMRPFLAVEGTGFKKFVDKLNKTFKPQIKLPSADTLAREAAIVDEALQLVLKNKILPNNVGHSDNPEAMIPMDTPFTLLSFTLDAWTSIAGKPYLGITLHYLTPQFEMKSHAIALRYFEPPHTAERYVTLFRAILDEYGYDIDTALSITTDSASVMCRMMEICNVIHTRCISHCINLAVQVDTFGEKDFKSLLENPNKLNGYFTSIATSRNHILQHMSGSQKPLVKAVQMVPTRWNSIPNMLRAHIERMPTIRKVDAVTLKIEPKEKANEYTRLVAACSIALPTHEGLLEILEPISKWSTLLQSSSQPTISLVFEARSDILAKLQNVKTGDRMAIKIRNHLVKVIQRRLDEDFVPIKLPAKVDKSHEKCRYVEQTRTRWKMINCAALLDVRTAFQHYSKLSQSPSDEEVIVEYIATCVDTWKNPSDDSTKDPSNISINDSIGDHSLLKRFLMNQNKTGFAYIMETVSLELVKYLLAVKKTYNYCD